MAGNMTVSMTLRLVDELSGPIKGIEAELNKLKTAADRIDLDKGVARAGAWQAESQSIRGVTAQLGTLQNAMRAAATASPIEATIVRFNEQKSAVQGVTAQLDSLKGAMSAAGSAAPIATAIASFNEERNAIRGVVSQLDNLQGALSTNGRAAPIATAIASFNEERNAIRGVVSQLDNLQGALSTAGSAAPIATAIASFNGERNAIRGVVSQLGDLQGAMSTAIRVGPVDAAIAKLNEERTTIDNVAAAMRNLGAASEQAAGAGAAASSRRRPGDPIDYGPRWDEPGGAGPARTRLRPGERTASDALDEREAERQPERVERLPQGGGFSGGGIIDGAVGIAETAAGMTLLRGSADQSATAQSLDVSMQAAGLSSEEITRIDRVSAEMSRQRLAFSRNSIVAKMQDARAVLGTVDHAEEALPTILDLATIVEAKHKGEGDEGTAQLLKGLEAANATNNIADFKRTANTIAKVMNIDGATISLADFGQFFNRAGATSAGLSQEFLGEDLPHVLQEMHGDAAGTMLRTLMRGTVGLRMDKTARRTMDEYGLLDESQVDDKGHLLPGAFKNAELMRSNPYLYANQVLKPALDAKGLSDTEEDQVLTQMFSNPNTARAMSIFMRQQPSIERAATNFRKSMGLDAAELFAENDPGLTSKAVGAQVENVEQLAGSNVMPTIMRMQRGLAGGIGTIAEVLNRVPGGAEAAGAGLAATVGGLGYVGVRTMTGGTAAILRTLGLGLGGAGEAAAGAAASAAGAGTAGAATAGSTTAAAAGSAAVSGAGYTLGYATGIAATSALIAAVGGGVMAGGIYAIRNASPDFGQRGRAEPRSQNDTDRPGHYVTGRFGIRNWVENREEFGPPIPPRTPMAGTTPSTIRDAVTPGGFGEREPIQMAPRGPTVQNTHQSVSVSVTAPITINATLNNTTPAAIGSAVRQGLGSAIRHAVPGSTSALHDGPETGRR